MSAPNLRIALDAMNADIQLGNNRANIDVTANAVGGGRLRVGGGVTLTGSLPADIQIALENVVLTDPKLYRTSVGGNLRVAGPLAGGAQISGQINVGETNVNVPSTGLTTIGDIPQITHIGADQAVIATRRKAGLTGAQSGTDPSAKSSGGGFGLNLQVNAPNRIFVRGRGLDAELGGGLTLTGTTNNVISAGRFELLRGRLDILGKRFDLVEGSVQFQGDLIPYLRFVSSTKTNAGEVRVIVQGPADEPEVIFESTPAAPQDEVLAQLLFGKNIDDISAFQALQLASAVATLAGRGGAGVVSRLRDGFGLDDLDVTTTDSGATAVRAGKYISDNVYSDVTAASDGTADISLNIDITPNLKGKATLGSDGDSGIGLFFEKDY
ncbi:translocation/assembly module TamB domain-containing protein [Sulfitobacter porphyrae]|uniref:Translocation/assembly module TamB domain-containing protein n=1 Tax=Sulfitobacter porphyrae TaxID=1246864 RepID=A0ABW2B4B5_9RHOB